LFFPSDAAGQNVPPAKTVTGVVLDGLTREPIIGASVVAEGGGSVGTATDFNGAFRLALPAEVEVLEVFYLGYVSQRVALKGRSHLEVALREDVTALSELVVVGYGAQKKETLTGAIAVLGPGELLQSPTANISNALVGRVPGISSVQSSGEPGHDAATIRIRGIGTLNADGQEPLMVIDGIQSTLSMFNALDANEIGSISVLKDASSTAVYGVRGAKGVIIDLSSG
jgi:TonB-dependent SusC/RagA subfamily outer membrane receptor